MPGVTAGLRPVIQRVHCPGVYSAHVRCVSMYILGPLLVHVSVNTRPGPCLLCVYVYVYWRVNPLPHFGDGVFGVCPAEEDDW